MPRGKTAAPTPRAPAQKGALKVNPNAYGTPSNRNADALHEGKTSTPKPGPVAPNTYSVPVQSYGSSSHQTSGAQPSPSLVGRNEE